MKCDYISFHVGVPQNELWELFGEMFFEFCEESGYDKIIRVLGGTLRDFLQVILIIKLPKPYTKPQVILIIFYINNLITVN